MPFGQIHPLLIVLTVFVVLYVSCFVHELGHAVVAALSGFCVTSFGVGLGRFHLVLPVRGCRLFLGIDRPFGGLTLAIPNDLIATKGRMALMAAGGCLANGLLAAMAAVAWQLAPELKHVWAAVIAFNLALFINLVPFQARMGNIRLSTDGMLILSALRGGHSQPEPTLAQGSAWMEQFLAGIGDERGRRLCATNAAIALLAVGDTEKARGFLDRCETPIPANMPAWIAPWELTARASLAEAEERASDAASLRNDAERAYASAGCAAGVVLTKIEQLVASAKQGESARARNELEHLVHDPAVRARPNLRHAIRTAGVRLLDVTHDGPAAVDLRRMLKGRKDANPAIWKVNARLALAQLAEHLAQPSDAALHYRHALETLGELAHLFHDRNEGRNFLDRQAKPIEAISAGLSRVEPSADLESLLKTALDGAQRENQKQKRSAERHHKLARIGKRIFMLDVFVVLGIAVLLLFDPFHWQSGRSPKGPEAYNRKPDLLLFGHAVGMLILLALGAVFLTLYRLAAVLIKPLRLRMGGWVLFWSLMPWVGAAFVWLTFAVAASARRA